MAYIQKIQRVGKVDRLKLTGLKITLNIIRED
jgi:hypothetical protein